MMKPMTKQQLAQSHRDEATAALRRKYREVYDTDAGELVLNDIINRICLYRAPVMSTNPMAVYIQGTRHDIANEVFRMIHSVDQPRGDE